MNNQRLRNLTTGRLHTEMGHVYEDLGFFTGEPGLMTHMLPRANKALLPWLKSQVTDPRFWDDKYDPTHEGETEIAPMDDEAKHTFWQRYGEMPNPLAHLA